MENDKEDLFSQETIDSLIELGKVLKKIHDRLRNEGYDIVDGEIVKVETGEAWIGNTRNLQCNRGKVKYF